VAPLAHFTLQQASVLKVADMNTCDILVRDLIYLMWNFLFLKTL
jgi:hypothetical protein